MDDVDPLGRIRLERERILSEYRLRANTIDEGRYAPWNPAHAFMVTESRTIAAEMLHENGVFPGRDTECLEVGYGRQGWLPDLLSWGVPSTRLHGIELDETRARTAQLLLPSADLRVGDATGLPWSDGLFGLVVVSTVFSSILDEEVRRKVATEVLRVVKPGGAAIVYDFTVDNPRNRSVQGIRVSDLRVLFAHTSICVRRVTLAPPLSRRIVPISTLAAHFLLALPFLRTHLMAVVVKGPEV
jgi:SAM-dependent methyltransferase